MKKQYDFSEGNRGAVVPIPTGKTRITIRLDEDVIEWFRQRVHEAGGGSYQSLINAALRKYIASKQEQLETTIRRVIREEVLKVVPSRRSASALVARTERRPRLTGRRTGAKKRRPAAARSPRG